MKGFRGSDHRVEVFDDALDLVVAQDAVQLPEADRERCVARRLQAADQRDPRHHQQPQVKVHCDSRHSRLPLQVTVHLESSIVIASGRATPRQRGRAWRVTARQGHPLAMALPLAGAK